MALPKFYCDLTQIILGDLVVLSEQESHHAVAVRRLQLNDELILLNGLGCKATGNIQQLTKRQVTVQVTDVELIQRPKLTMHVAAAIPKGDRQKMMLDMLVQQGIGSFTPLVCDFSVTKISDKLMQKWQRSLLESCKQSENPFLPTLQAPMTVQKCVQHAEEQSYAVVYADIDGQTKPELSRPQLQLLVGPEGGFSPVERGFLQQRSVDCLSLSGHILRVETAAVAAVAVMSAFYG